MRFIKIMELIYVQTRVKGQGSPGKEKEIRLRLYNLHNHFHEGSWIC